MRKSPRCLPAAFLVIALLNFHTAAQTAEKPPLTFGIAPQQNATKLARLWTPICKHISERMGCTVLFNTARDIPTFESRLKEGRYDIAYMNPYHYTVFSTNPGYRAFAKETNKQIRGIVVVREESFFQSIADLNGRTLAFPAPTAFAASVLPRAHFKKLGIEITARYVNSHDSVYLTVSKGLYAGGGGIRRTFASIPQAVRERLRVLWTTPGYTPHAFAAHPRVSAEVVQAASTALIEMGRDEKGAALLKKINFTPLGPAENENWNDVRELGIDPLQHIKKE